MDGVRGASLPAGIAAVLAVDGGELVQVVSERLTSSEAAKAIALALAKIPKFIVVRDSELNDPP